MKLKMKLITAAALVAAIQSIGKQRNEYDLAVQEAALQVLGQSWAHRNITPAMELVKAVSKHDRPTLVTYLERFGQMKWDTKNEQLAFLDRAKEFEPKGEKTTEQLFEVFEDVMTAAKWYDAKKPPVVKSQYDAEVELGNLMDRLFKKAAKGATVAHKEVLDACHAAYCRVIADRYGKKEEPVPQGQQPAHTNTAGVVTADRVNELAQQAQTRATAEQLEKLEEKFGGQPQAVAA